MRTFYVRSARNSPSRRRYHSTPFCNQLRASKLYAKSEAVIATMNIRPCTFCITFEGARAA